MSKEFIDFCMNKEILETFTSQVPYSKTPRCLTLPHFKDDDSPCKECIVQACCIKKCELYKNWNEGKHFQTLVECWVNLGIGIFGKMRNVEHPIGHSSPSGIPIKFIFLFKLICRLLGYVVNCRSWEDKKIHYFDKDEFKQRIKQLKMF